MPPLAAVADAGSQHLYASGAFANAHNFVLNNPVMVNAIGDDFMKEFSEHTMRGAELDSSARDPPPRCHPGTRVEIVDRIRHRLRNALPAKRMQWLVGPAGVGKSAIMQTVAELEREASSILAALFFSALNGCNDPRKVITTLAYQITLQHEGYRDHIRSKVKINPNIWDKSIDAQFNEFIVEPFVARKIYEAPNPVLMFIDGLDECNGQREQVLFLSLISDFTTKHPQAPLLWIIASRPENHITTHLARKQFVSSFEEEKVAIDSTEACQDVERFLRAQFEDIRESNPLIQSLYPQWPPENQFLKLVAAALGLFAYAETVIRFISDLTNGDPISRFQIILNLIDNSSPTVGTSATHPMTRLDTLYRYILSQVAPDHMLQTRKVLSFVIFYGDCKYINQIRSLSGMCDWIRMPPNVLYGCLCQLHSVIHVPLPGNAEAEPVRIYHKSFSDFLLDPQRSGIDLGTEEHEEQRSVSRAVGILLDVPRRGSPGSFPDPGKFTVLSWPRDKAATDLDHERRSLYARACLVLAKTSALPRRLPLSVIAHALKVLDFSLVTVNPELLRLIFDATSSLGRLLREDTVLQDVPSSLIDPGSILDKRPTLYVTGGLRAYWVSEKEHDYAMHPEKLRLQLDHVTAVSADNLLTVFIGNRLQGFVQYNATIPTRALREPITYYFFHDFSTIYTRLKKQDEGEGSGDV